MEKRADDSTDFLKQKCPRQPGYVRRLIQVAKWRHMEHAGTVVSGSELQSNVKFSGITLFSIVTLKVEKKNQNPRRQKTTTNN